MADKDLSSITAGTTPLDGTEFVLVTQGGNSRRVTTADVGTVAGSVTSEAGTAVVASAAEVGTFKRFTATSAITYTLNTGVFSAGQEILIEQVNAGVVTVTAGAGFTLNSRGNLFSTNGPGAVVGIKFVSATEATVFGDRA